jgi:hypothetical protein
VYADSDAIFSPAPKEYLLLWCLQPGEPKWVLHCRSLLQTRDFSFEEAVVSTTEYVDVSELRYPADYVSYNKQNMEND